MLGQEKKRMGLASVEKETSGEGRVGGLGAGRTTTLPTGSRLGSGPLPG